MQIVTNRTTFNRLAALKCVEQINERIDYEISDREMNVFTLKG